MKYAAMKAATRASAPMCTGSTVAIRKTTNRIKMRTSCTDTGVPCGCGGLIARVPAVSAIRNALSALGYLSGRVRPVSRITRGVYARAADPSVGRYLPPSELRAGDLRRDERRFHGTGGRKHGRPTLPADPGADQRPRPGSPRDGPPDD